MSWKIFGRTPGDQEGQKASPQDEAALEAAVARVAGVLKEVPRGQGADPSVIAHRAQLDDVTALAALNVLRRRGAGDFGVQVLNSRGQAVATYDFLEEVPHELEDDYGEPVHVEQRNLRFVFRPTRHGEAVR